jgi:hypothetical protein
MKYIYTGPVSDGTKELARQWHGETVAPTLEKAKSNLKYQFNTQYNRLPYCKVEFDINKIKIN